MPPLAPRIRKILEKSIAQGVPPVAAGMALGLSAKVINTWIQSGLAYLDKPVKLEGNPEENIDCGSLGNMRNADYHLHLKECAALARKVVEVEGTIIGGLVKRMWKVSKRDPDMMKFLFKQYKHAHGLHEDKGAGHAEAAPAADGGPSEEDRVIIMLPDNGRMIKK